MLVKKQKGILWIQLLINESYDSDIWDVAGLVHKEDKKIWGKIEKSRK
ncbi:MAG: hypothetical protein HFG38_04420 [Eubacterium sp.]|nr:hypothetical protein [Eubacterium sp.]